MVDVESVLNDAGLTNPAVQEYVRYWADHTGADRVEVVNSSDDDRLIQAIRNGGQDTINDAGQQIVRRQLNIAPTLTIRPGFPVRVIVTRDLVLEPYGG